MPKQVMLNPVITINSVNLSDHIASVTIDENFDEVDTTAFGSTARTRVAGLGDHSISLDFHQDYATSSVEQTIDSLVGTVVPVTVKPTNAAIAADNPEYQFSCLITAWQPVNGAVGDLAVASISWPISGAITRDITP